MVKIDDSDERVFDSGHSARENREIEVQTQRRYNNEERVDENRDRRESGDRVRLICHQHDFDGRGTGFDEGRQVTVKG